MIRFTLFVNVHQIGLTSIANYRNVINYRYICVSGCVTVMRFILCTTANFKVKGNPGTLQSADVESCINPDAAYQTSFLLQFTTLTKRNFLRQKDRYLSTIWLTQIVAISVIMGLVWFQLPRVEETARDRFGLVTFFASYRSVFGFRTTLRL